MEEAHITASDWSSRMGGALTKRLPRYRNCIARQNIAYFMNCPFIIIFLLTVFCFKYLKNRKTCHMEGRGGGVGGICSRIYFGGSGIYWMSKRNEDKLSLYLRI